MLTGELSLDAGSAGRPAGRPRVVEVAIDAAGGGGARTYTYAVPDGLADIQPGEPVLVEFGRRQALALVLGDTDPPSGIELKPVAARVRSDGALLPPLALSLARWIAAHYLAPPATVVRAMLPPGMLEKLDLVAERLPDSSARDGLGGDARGGDLPPQDRDLLAQLDRGPKPVRSLVAPEGRAGLLRRLRSLESGGLVALEWTLSAAGAGPRYERRVALTGDGRDAAATLAAGARPEGRPLGPRQVAALAELLASPADAPDTTVPAADLADRHGHATIAGLARRGFVRVAVRERPRRPLAGRPPGLRGARPPGAPLTEPQQLAVDMVRRAIVQRDPTPLLLDGVTGGGKTAIYVEAIAASLEAGRPALVLVPEIALATPIVDRLRADLGARVALVHSGLSDGERADEWRRIRAGDVDIVAGTRLAVLAPLRDVGVVIIDEEHEAAYKSDRTPRLQARDTAIRLGELAGAAVVLGSATPAVDSVGRARDTAYRRVVLPTRPSGDPPAVEVVDLRAELRDGNRGLMSSRLARAVAGLDRAAGDQAILVINRRGTASVVLCRDCGHVQACPDCERPLVFHQAGATLRCHHCGRATPLASRCPSCGSPRIRYLGGGTERVEREVRERFPALRVARLDRDVVERKGAAERVLDAFAAGDVDVLVGTSLVAKGLDVPNVTLVGIVSADVSLNLPDERAAERTYQLLAQAVGRAGRGDRRGTAIIQSYQPEHPAILAVANDDAAAFYDAELELRRRFGSPPFGRLVKLTCAVQDRDKAEATARGLADDLRNRAAERFSDTTVAGPAPAYIARRADRWRWNIVLRGSDPAALLDGGLDAPWSVDVDPESLL
ncbi:MAG TPA: primosomal protein N' [Candidatus Limnocylindrales bacterium]|nr:primosomal protein N' [Candidatus Limnocylindrales bacterium]